tara:strand:+ start:1064 stop:1459 length:396 start_codon:yes stop_codon:yes gene_type:complete
MAYISTLLDGGYTRLLDRTINPTEGYIVGGVTEPTTMYAEVDGSAYADVSEHYAQFKKLWGKYDLKMWDKHTTPVRGKYDAGLGVGTWIHEGQIYFDLVQHIHELDVATKVAKERGEIAIYDCTNQKEILL